MLLEFAAMETSDGNVTPDTAASDTEQHGEDAPPVPSEVSEPEAHSADPIPPEQSVDVEDSGSTPVIEATPPEPSTDFTVKVSDHAVNTVVVNGKEPESSPLTSIEGLSVDDLNRLSRVIADEKSKRGQVAPRPFENVDTESLLVLQNQLRGELASR